jgi:hypothetical protein
VTVLLLELTCTNTWFLPWYPWPLNTPVTTGQSRAKLGENKTGSPFCVALPGHANFLEVSFQEESERIAPGAELKYDIGTQKKSRVPKKIL